MAALALIGVVLIALMGAVIYANKRSLPTSSRTFPIPSAPDRNPPVSQTLTEQIEWREIDIPSDSGQNGWREINLPTQVGEIEWVDLETGDYTPLDEHFLNPDVPDNLDNILRDVIGTRDICSQEIFHPGEKVYLCRRHKLAYHEDSWRELGCKCPSCENAEHTRDYTLPRSI